MSSLSTNSLLLVSARPSLTRMAVIQAGHLVEIFSVSSNDRQTSIGSIYKGKIERVIPGLNAAFVNFGDSQKGYLDLKDLPADTFGSKLKRDRSGGSLKVGDSLLVQLKKESFGSKGPKFTADIALSGRYLVVHQSGTRISISKKIEEKSEKNRLRQLVSSFWGGDRTVVIRTAAIGRSVDELIKDYQELVARMIKIEECYKSQSHLGILEQQNDFVFDFIVNRSKLKFENIIVDSQELLESMKLHELFVGGFSKSVLSYHSDKKSLFETFKVDEQFCKAFSRRVALKNGCEIVIDETEALTSIDVNSSKFDFEKNGVNSLLKVNESCAEEIARQVRLRNLSGIIIVDFIDLKTAKDRKLVELKFAEAMKDDFAKCRILPINELGLLQMTRERISDSIAGINLDSCIYCNGSGKRRNLAFEIQMLLTELENLRARFPNRDQVSITCD